MLTPKEMAFAKRWLGPARDRPKGPQMIEVNKASLLAVVRKIDVGSNTPGIDFPSAFDDLRMAFTADEIATGQLRAMPGPTPETDYSKDTNDTGMI